MSRIEYVRRLTPLLADCGDGEVGNKAARGLLQLFAEVKKGARKPFLAKAAGTAGTMTKCAMIARDKKSCKICLDAVKNMAAIVAKNLA